MAPWPSLYQCESTAAPGMCRASTLGYLIGAPLLLLFGTAGNLWTAVVATRCSLRRSQASALILAHALFDTLALWTGLTRHFIMNVSTVDVRELSAASCKLQRFILYTAMDASATMLAAISVDRFVAVWMPHRKKYFTVARARIVVCCLALSSIAFNLHVLWTRGEQVLPATKAVGAFSNGLAVNGSVSGVVKMCGYPQPEYAAFWAKYQGWLGLAYFCVVPFLIMAVLNTLTAIRLRRLYNERAANAGEGASRQRGRSGPASFDRSRLTIMLLVASFFFVCVTAPAFLYNNIEAMSDYSLISEAARWRLQVADTYTTLLQYLNHAISFYLYVLTGRGFRRDVYDSLRRVWTSASRRGFSSRSIDSEAASLGVRARSLTAALAQTSSARISKAMQATGSTWQLQASSPTSSDPHTGSGCDSAASGDGFTNLSYAASETSVNAELGHDRVAER